MKLPKISVITPSFNQGAYIERTIKSVLSQGYRNLEYIVVDGKSRDKTVRILKKYENHLRWYSEPDRGQADAINKGLRISTGEVLTYLNSDDTYEPGALITIGQCFAKHPKTQFLYGRGKLINHLDQVIGIYNDSQMDHEKLYASCGISQPTAFWRREVYRTIGEFDTTLQYTMDYDYWIRISKYYRLYFLRRAVIANTRIHGQAKTSMAAHSLHKEAMLTTKSHYGSIHYDWIFTYADSAFDGPKDTKAYYRHMVVRSLYYFIKYNYALPVGSSAKILLSWLRKTI